MKYYIPLLFFVFLLSQYSSLTHADDSNKKMSEVLVTSDIIFSDTRRISPSALIDKDALEKINITTVEDALSYTPNLIIRRRFIGDPNGVVGIRGSNMFQGTRTSVYVDGMPIHYHLQTRFSGSPRWSLVSPGETQSIEVLYGPFSAEYSGNAMGGVVNVTTQEPTEQKIRLEGAVFSQDYSQFATDESYTGGKFFTSYENKFDHFTVFASYNHLENESQPQTQFRTTDIEGFDNANLNGAFLSDDEFGNAAYYFGDSGAEKATTDLYKVKLGYHFGDYKLRSSIAYEERERDSSDSNNYLTNANGNVDWSFGSGNFQNRIQQRNSLLVGIGFDGPLNNDWVFDTHYSYFDIVKDEEVRTGRNPNDPDFTAQNTDFRGRLTNFDDTGWQIFNFKAGTENFLGHDNMRLSIGAHYDKYTLEINPFNYNSITEEIGTARNASGGETQTMAIFAQYGYQFSPKWDIALGLRYEEWEANNAFTGTTQIMNGRKEEGLSPKFSLAYLASDDFTIRYSAAKALRFAIVEELYRNESTVVNSAGSQFIGDPSLEPEDGFHQNLSFEKRFGSTIFNFNIFYDKVNDVIFNSSATVVAADNSQSSVTTSLPVSEVTTKGAEIVFNQSSVLGSDLDMRVNVSYTDSKITENIFDPTIEFKQFPRVPKWRVNALLSYPLTDSLDLSGGVRYASNSFGRLDNADVGGTVFGAQDEFTFINTKLNWRANSAASFGLGIDNIFNEEAYVFHPWPSRTMYLDAKFEF